MHSATGQEPFIPDFCIQLVLCSKVNAFKYGRLSYHVKSNLQMIASQSKKQDWEIFSKQECIPVGCVPSAAVAVSVGRSARHLPLWTEWQTGLKNYLAATMLQIVTRMHSSRMCTAHFSDHLGDVCPGGVCLGVGCTPSCPLHAWIHVSPLWTEFLTNVYENITFPQLLLWVVIKLLLLFVWSKCVEHSELTHKMCQIEFELQDKTHVKLCSFPFSEFLPCCSKVRMQMVKWSTPTGEKF